MTGQRPEQLPIGFKIGRPWSRELYERVRPPCLLCGTWYCERFMCKCTGEQSGIPCPDCERDPEGVVKGCIRRGLPCGEEYCDACSAIR